MKPPPLFATPLNAAAFAPFGDVLAYDAATSRLVNDGFALRSDTAARLEADGGVPVLSIYRASARRLPLEIPTLERHPHSSQSFFPLTALRFLVVVAPATADGWPELAHARAFVGGSQQGITYRPGVWHAPITALDQDGDLLMLIWERGSEEDCLTQPCAPVLHVNLP
jgi:ureidoglycolate lyase